MKQKIHNKIIGLLAAAGLMYGTAVANMPSANAVEFPEKGKIAVGADARFTTNRKVADDSGEAAKMSVNEYAGEAAYGLTEWFAPYVKVGAGNVNVNAAGEKMDFGTGLLWGAGGMARVKGLPGNLEARLKAGYESISGLNSTINSDVPVSLDLSIHKVPAEGTLYKNFGKIAVEGGIAYEYLGGELNASAMGSEGNTGIKGKNNLGGVARLTAKATKNTSLIAYYNSIGNTFGGQVTIKF